jgi:hypothetical protein
MQDCESAGARACRPHGVRGGAQPARGRRVDREGQEPPRLSRKSRERLTEKLDAYKHCSGCHRTFVPQRHGALTAVTSVSTMAYRPMLQF